MSKLCVGATLGPVFQTMNLARKPGEIWMASYMFSRISKEMYEWLQNNAGHDIEFYSPYDKDDAGKTIPISPAAGAYSDHLFFELKDTDEESARSLLADAKKHALALLMKDMKAAGAISEEEEAECLNFLDRYVYVLPTFKLIGDEEKIKTHELTRELDLLELYPPFNPVEELNRTVKSRSDYLLRYLNAETLQRSSWVKEALGSFSFDFSDMPSTAPLDRQQREYIAMVQADGDGMGSLLHDLSACGDLEGLRKVSAFLFRQTDTNIKRVLDYGGLPIYFGGDDMLFFAPLRGKDDQNIFELVSELSDMFDKAWESIAPQLNTSAPVAPSLSFGIALYYQKHPLRFIREAASSALFGQAKNAVWADGKKKKAIQIELRKHSGQTSRILLSNHKMADGETPYSLFIETIKEKADEKTLHSLHWKLIGQWNIIFYLLNIEDGEERKNRLKSWFENNFNEWLEEKDNKAKGTPNAQKDEATKSSQTERELKNAFINATVDFLCTLSDQAKTEKKRGLQIGKMLKEYYKGSKEQREELLSVLTNKPENCSISREKRIADAIEAYQEEDFRYGKEMFILSAVQLLSALDWQKANEKNELMHQVDCAFRIDEFLHAKKKNALSGDKGGETHE